MRRRGRIEAVKGMPPQSAADKATAALAEKQASIMKARQVAQRKAKVGKDVECTKGTMQLSPLEGVSSWTFRWGHCPGRNGVSDAVGLCSDDFASFGPHPGPLLGASPPVVEKKKNKWGYYSYSRPAAADAPVSSIALYANGTVLHGGKAVGDVDCDEHGVDNNGTYEGAANTKLLFSKGSRVTVTFDTDTDRGKLTSKNISSTYYSVCGAKYLH